MNERFATDPPAYQAPTSSVQDRALEAAASAKETLVGGTEKIKDYIGKQPARALGIALGVGVLLGWLIKRR